MAAVANNITRQCTLWTALRWSHLNLHLLLCLLYLAPQGRSVVAVANDITWQSGAFSPAEDAVFRAAVDYALEERLPLLYLAANAGARVGLATEVGVCTWGEGQGSGTRARSLAVRCVARRLERAGCGTRVELLVGG